MKVELLLVTGDGEVIEHINNLLGIDENVLVNALIHSGEMRFFPTERVRILGYRDKPNMIFELLKRTDVEVTFFGRTIFKDPTWSRVFVEEMCRQVCPSPDNTDLLGSVGLN
ncbi:MAG: hypothetical protein UY48_C0038G0029 [Candidatus Gottesmanbacteria bacterium GW2011_GWB1_49_7]|uniref:Uncharacterized protein n=1 Tax=Candidatus Gottesmanbacteria bacterium GW2011_GWB1_49_7 TaxID=1618448 RepID=A0A0G1YVP1_9BACT|nr:MAG: hypothetical protein UY48_C0038G0029 [Candidatus Gottesmanbacteria bacterium GW2011_GWB1_49_7]